MEVWKDIKGFEGSYQISNLGRVKSLDRYVNWKDTTAKIKEKILKSQLYDNGYLYIKLGSKSFRISILVWDHFGDKQRQDKQVDHIKEKDKTNNRIDNLQLLTKNENISKRFKKDCVGWYDKNTLKWRSAIQIDKKRKYPGSFETELEAHNAYQKALEKINEL